MYWRHQRRQAAGSTATIDLHGSAAEIAAALAGAVRHDALPTYSHLKCAHDILWHNVGISWLVWSGFRVRNMLACRPRFFFLQKLSRQDIEALLARERAFQNRFAVKHMFEQMLGLK